MTASEMPLMHRRAHKESVAVAAHFERLIASRELEPGFRFPSERELATQLSVSRTTLREAMHELESKRLIERVPGRGTTVLAPPIESEELRRIDGHSADRDNVAELRAIIEPSVAELAALRATAANILQLQDVLDQSTGELRASESYRLDLEFHLLLAQAAGNPLLTTLHSLMGSWTAQVRKHSHATTKGRRMSIDGHRAILDAVRAGDPNAARRAMELHLGEVRDAIDEVAG